MLSRLFSTSSQSSSNHTNGSFETDTLNYQPTPRWGHTAAAINDKLYIWGGCMEDLPKIHSSTEKTQFLSAVEIFDPHSLQWERKQTTGNPPLGAYWNAYTVKDKNLYTFGGYCGHGKCYHNSIHQLDTGLLQWKERVAMNPSDSPMKKWQCGMVSFTANGEDHLCVFGGWGILSPTHKNMEHEFVADRANLGCVWSNELHYFNLKKGTWECPSTTGSHPPPCQGFTFTLIDDDRIVLFGGFQPTTKRRINDVYILNIHTMHCIRLYNRPDPTIVWPQGRDDHSACVKNGTCPLLLTVGGVNNQFNTLADLWVLDVDSGKWKQVSAPQSAVGRRGHTVTVFSLGPHHFMLVVYGGISEWLVDKSHREQPIITETAVVELVENDGGDWRMMHSEPTTITISSSPPFNFKDANFQNGFTTGSYLAQKTEITDNSKKSRRARASVSSSNGNVNTMTLDRKSQNQKQMDETKREMKLLQTQLIDAVNALRKAKREQKDTEIENKELSRQLDEVKMELKGVQSKLFEAEEKVFQAEKTAENQKLIIDDLQSQKSNTPPNSSTPERGGSPNTEKSFVANGEIAQHSWVVSKEEIHFTQAEISRDKWSSTRVASFRGLHVAARCFKEGILSEETTPSYISAMSLGTKAHHPNLIQFLGASIGPETIVLTELMPTTLQMTLRQGPLTKRQALSVASDIAGVLDYLHRWRPASILHKNVSTNCVLLEPMGNNTWKAKLSDYGSSNFFSVLSVKSTSPSLQKSIFTAPEAKSPELHSPKMDVYGFGIILLEMCQPKMINTAVPGGGGNGHGHDIHYRIQHMLWTTMASIIRASVCPAPHDRLSMSEIIKKLSSGSSSETLL